MKPLICVYSDGEKPPFIAKDLTEINNRLKDTFGGNRINSTTSRANCFTIAWRPAGGHPLYLNCNPMTDGDVDAAVNPIADSEEITEARREKLSDPVILWEAIGVDGIDYPFCTNTLVMNSERRDEVKDMKWKYDAAIEKTLVELIADKNDLKIGRLLREQAEAYVDGVGDE